MIVGYQCLNTPIGPLVIAADDRLKAVVFEDQWPAVKEKFEASEEKTNSVIEETKSQLEEYFQGNRTSFDLPLDPLGTDFQRKAWMSLREIPFGETRSYKQQALSLSAPAAIRAVGRANGQNPLCIVLPCHRVVGHDGSLTGYAGGLAAKRYLLNLEKRP